MKATLTSPILVTSVFSLIFLTSCIGGDLMDKTESNMVMVTRAATPVGSIPVTSAETTTLYPLEVLAIDAKLADNQPVEVLSVQDQTDLEQNWSRYMQLEPVENFNTIFKFDLNKSLTEVKKLTLSFNFLGYRADLQEWKFEMQDLVTGDWVTVAKNDTVTPWHWSLMTVSIENPARFVNLNGTIELRLNSDFTESSQYKTPVYLDYLSLELVSL